jgi:hypothetical protein
MLLNPVYIPGRRDNQILTDQKEKEKGNKREGI